MKQRILFLCTHNSARSQMAEGFLRHETSDQFEVYSAGTEATQLRQEAIQVMAELERRSRNGKDEVDRESQTWLAQEKRTR